MYIRCENLRLTSLFEKGTCPRCMGAEQHVQQTRQLKSISRKPEHSGKSKDSSHRGLSFYNASVVFMFAATGLPPNDSLSSLRI